jgi:uncharacterized protein YeaO (DUF488 family)
MIRLKRAYEAAVASDGHRVLVERLWPRGLRKEDAHLDEWAKDLAPSVALRKWFSHDPDRFREFRARYLRELEADEAQEWLDALAQRAARKTVTLVFSSHDQEHNNAVVLAEELDRRLKKLARSGARSKPRAAAHRSAVGPHVR